MSSIFISSGVGRPSEIGVGMGDNAWVVDEESLMMTAGGDRTIFKELAVVEEIDDDGSQGSDGGLYTSMTAEGFSSEFSAC